MSDKKKIQERRYFEAFAKTWIKETCEHVDFCREKPDGSFRLDGRAVGIEVTKLYRGPNPAVLQEQEALGEQVARKASGLVACPDLAVAFSLTKASKKKVPQIAEALAHLVRENAPREDSWRGRPDETNYERWPRSIEYVHVARLAGLGASQWIYEDRADYPDPTLRNAVRAALEAKELRLGGYESFDEQWLLMVVDDHNQSGLFAPSEDSLTATYPSSFDRAFLLFTFGARVHELQVKKPSP